MIFHFIIFLRLQINLEFLFIETLNDRYDQFVVKILSFFENLRHFVVFKLKTNFTHDIRKGVHQTNQYQFCFGLESVQFRSLYTQGFDSYLEGFTQSQKLSHVICINPSIFAKVFFLFTLMFSYKTLNDPVVFIKLHFLAEVKDSKRFLCTCRFRCHF